MSQRVDKGQIAKFKHDRDLLPYDDVFIAETMRMAKSNYSNYINGRIPISKAFLNKFYTAFGDKIKELYKDHGQQSDPIIELSKKNEALASKYDQLAESNHKIFTEIYNLEHKLDAILEERLSKIELLISRLIDQKKNLSEDHPDKKLPL